MTAGNEEYIGSLLNSTEQKVGDYIFKSSWINLQCGGGKSDKDLALSPISYLSRGPG